MRSPLPFGTTMATLEQVAEPPSLSLLTIRIVLRRGCFLGGIHPQSSSSHPDPWCLIHCALSRGTQPDHAGTRPRLFPTLARELLDVPRPHAIERSCAYRPHQCLCSPCPLLTDFHEYAQQRLPRQLVLYHFLFRLVRCQQGVRQAKSAHSDTHCLLPTQYQFTWFILRFTGTNSRGILHVKALSTASSSPRHAIVVPSPYASHHHFRSVMPSMRRRSLSHLPRNSHSARPRRDYKGTWEITSPQGVNRASSGGISCCLAARSLPDAVRPIPTLKSYLRPSDRLPPTVDVLSHVWTVLVLTSSPLPFNATNLFLRSINDNFE